MSSEEFKLIKEMIDDSKNQSSLYVAGNFWKYYEKNILKQIKKNDLTKFRSMAFVLELERPRVNFESSFIASLPSPLLLLLAFDTDVADVSSKCIEDVSIILFNIDTFCCSLEEDTIVEGELEEEE